jgi:predicted nucleic acid-binding protein
VNVLVDTPVWSAALRRAAPRSTQANTLAELIRQGRAQLIGPVRQELLSGIRQVAQFERLRDDLRAFVDLPIETADHEQAADYFNICRGHGIQGSNTDYLLCAVAVRRGLTLFTTDADFDHYARHVPLVLHRP